MDMMFLFDLVQLGTCDADKFRYEPFSGIDFKKAVEVQSSFIKGTDAWSTVFIENHDQARCTTKFGDTSPEYLGVSAKMLATLQATLTGTLFLYQGQEIGMTNLPPDWDIDEYKDIQTINYWTEFLKTNPTESEKKKLMKNIGHFARDHARSPVQWDDSTYAGFSKVEPWTRVNDNYKELNVEKQTNDPNSVLSYYKKALKVRHDYPDLFVHGEFNHVEFDNEKVMSYTKTFNGKTAYVVLNLTKETVPFHVQVEGDLKLVLTNIDQEDEGSLKPFESRVYLVQ
ncbi:unnamed protein product [Ambrosiozyma monospora]|uniref:Unnamed protein product n=1 Tax=Ambrosiozyma monospora TaxID=43982 RepID=A0ACB5U992_AMBMO|nr:unnamed protein product [Ambrosiozyma monospora]